MNAKEFEQIAADSIVDALHWKTRARNAEDNARELLAALSIAIDHIEALTGSDDSETLDYLRQTLAKVSS